MRIRQAAISVHLLMAAAILAAPPNVVMIVSDDHGWTDFGFMGHDVVRTPHLDRLAAESATFVNGYVPTSLCRASLATLLTGQYAHEHRICCNDPPEGVDRSLMLPFMRNAPALPRLLGGAGYASLQTGKFWEGHYSNAGFTHGMTENRVRGRHGDEGLKIGRETMQPLYDFIGAHKEKPFFVWYAPMMPHEPHNPPKRFLDRYTAPGRPIQLARYYAMCEWFDHTCGELLKYLDDQGLRDNTLVVFVVDNGWIQNLASRPADGPRERKFTDRSKRSPYDGGLRTPILLRWPGRIEPGRREELVSTVDIAPTILRACGVEPPAGMSGMNLLDLLAGKVKPRDAVYGEIYVHTAVDIERTDLSVTHRWTRRGDWKLIRPEQGEPELYNVAKDPFEERNLAPQEPEKVKELQATLQAWWTPKK